MAKMCKCYLVFETCLPNVLQILKYFYCHCQADSEEDEEVFDSSKESVELFCVDAREKLTNSIRLQWRRLKSHVERLDSEGILHAAYCHCLILIHGVYLRFLYR